jgi:hypothetical protein
MTDICRKKHLLVFKKVMHEARFASHSFNNSADHLHGPHPPKHPQSNHSTFLDRQREKKGKYWTTPV